MSASFTMDSSLVAIILAAGQGKRMGSDLPKVAHEVAGAPMVSWVARACREAGCVRSIVVVGHRQEVVRRIFDEAEASMGEIEFVVQEDQRGTGHAVGCAAASLSEFAGDVIVLAGDGPLVRPKALVDLVERHRRERASATLATVVVDDPAGYGRILRDSEGRFTGVVEDKNATPQERKIHEVNPSVYCFRAVDLFATLDRVPRNEASGEYYLTDVPALLKAQSKRIDAVNSLRPDEALSVNTLDQLKQVDQMLRSRLATAEGC